MFIEKSRLSVTNDFSVEFFWRKKGTKKRFLKEIVRLKKIYIDCYKQSFKKNRLQTGKKFLKK